MQTLIQQAMKNGGGAVESTGAEIPFDPTSYRSVHFLAANTEKRPFEDLLKKTVQGGDNYMLSWFKIFGREISIFKKVLSKPGPGQPLRVKGPIHM